MKSTRKTAIFAAFFAFAALANGADPVFAGQKMQAIMNNTEIGRELSAGELLQQFRTERERLIRQKAKDKQPHLIKNKIKILDGKISFLESQMRTRPSVNPAAKPAVSVPAPKTPRAAISVPMRPYARPEARRRIFLARVPAAVPNQPWARVSERLAPQTQAVPAKAPVPMAPALPKPAAVQPVAVKPAPAPVKVEMVPATGPSARSQAAEQPVPVKTVPIAAPSQPAPGARAPKTGREWKEMNAAEKDIYALSVMGNLGRHDVFLEKSYSFYVREIDRRLGADASLDGEYVYRILITSAYENEPEVRQDIDKIGK